MLLRGGGDGLCWGGMAVGCDGLVTCFPSLSSLSSSSSSLLIGVRGSARAALRARTLSPNTIVFPCCLAYLSSLFSPLPAFLLPSVFPFIGMAVGVYHVSVCCVGMTAMGSLSRSSSFFW